MNTPNITKIDRVLQFILTAAGQEDDFRDRELGPIHLIKYLYLADLAYAEEHGGETYTGTSWKFHHFGPWSNEAYTRIEPALKEIGATRKEVPSKYEGDIVRWVVRNDDLYRHLSEKLPSELSRSIRTYVHQFNGLTEDLLHFVYETRPMLKARPGALLDMSAASKESFTELHCPENSITTPKDLSFKEKKRRRQAIETLREHLRGRLEARMRLPRVKPRAPRHDDVYYEGLKALESLAGEDIQATKGIVHFSDDIWESKARFDPDVS